MMNHLTIRTWVLGLMGYVLLAGCGGGGSGGDGGGGTATTVPRFAYVANSADDTVSIYTVDATTGQLHARGYVSTGTTPRAVTTTAGVQR